MFVRSDKVLGSGSFSNVYRGHRVEDNLPVAIKVFNSKVSKVSARQECEVCNTLKDLSIPGIVRFYDVVCDESAGKYEIVMERLTGGELFERILNMGKFSESLAAQSMYKLFNTLHQVHTVGKIIHADMKPENIVYVDEKEDSPFRIIDFGFSFHASAETIAHGVKKHDLVGTFGYMAPETYFERKYSGKADMWSFGVILYVLLSGTMPFDVESKNFQKKLKIAQYYSIETRIWANISSEAKDLVRRLLSLDLEARPTAQEAMSHPWFALHGVSSTGMTPRAADSVQQYNQEFDTQYIERLKAATSKQKFRKAVNGIIWTNRIRKAALSKVILRESQISENEVMQGTETISSDSSNLSARSPFLPQIGVSKGPSVQASYASSTSDLKPSASKGNDSGALSSRRYSSKLTDDVGNSTLDGTHAFARIQSRVVDSDTPVLEAGVKSPRISENTDSNGPPIVSFSDEEVLILKEVFENRMDGCSSNGVSFELYCQVCESVGLGILARKHIFEIFDADKNGSVDYKEFLATLTSFQNISDKSLRLYFDLFDKNNDGGLSLEEFQYVLGSCLSFVIVNLNAPNNESVDIDTAGSDLVSSPSYEKAITPNRPIIRSEERDINSVFEEMDINKDGVISYEEFSLWMRNNFELVRHNFIPSIMKNLE